MPNPTKLRGVAVAVLTLAVVSASGCSWFRGKSGYENAPESRPLEIPPDLDTPVTDSTMRVPAASGSAAAAPVGARPVAAAPSQSFVVADTPDSVWGRLGIALTRVDGVTVGESSRMLSVYNVTFEGETFLVRISPDGEGTRIAAVSEAGKELDSGAGAKLLGLLRQRLG